MSTDHDHRGEYADDRHDHDDRYAEDRHHHYGTEREVDRLLGGLREASAQTELLRREHAEEIRQLWERVRLLEAILQPQPQAGERIVCGNTFRYGDSEISGEDETDDRDDWDAANWDAAALLPTGETMNPARPEGATYYDARQVAYIVRKTDPGSTGLIRVLTSFGEPAGWTLGSEHDIRHDQTARDLGRYRVTGIRNYVTGWQAGEIPDRPVRHWVFK